MFNAVTYFETNCQKLRLTVEGKYKFCRVTGIDYMEDILSNIKSSAYFAVDDTDDGVVVREGAGYFNKRVITVFLLRKFNISNQKDREEKLAETRLIRTKLIAKLIKDSNTLPELMFLDKSRFPYKEVPGYWAAGTCGIYFFITIKEPVSLVYDANDYID